MSQIARLKATQIANGNVINADDINAELNQLVDESNAQDIRLGDVETGNITLQGTKTFASAPKMDEVLESTAGNGILAEEVRLKQGSIVLSAVIRINGVDTTTERLSTSIAHGLTTGNAVRVQTDDTLPSPLSASTTYYVNVASATEVTLHTTTTAALAGTGAVNLTTSGIGNHALLADPPSVANGQLWFNAAQQQVKARLNNTTWSMLTTQYLANILLGPAPSYVSASAIKLPAGLRALDSTNTHLIELISDITLNLGSAGVNGLDTGSEANDTWYYIYLIDDSTGTNNPAGLFSTVNEVVTGSITLPTGYDIKRQLPLAVRNNSSGDLINFSIGHWGPRTTEVFYNVGTTVVTAGATKTAGPTVIVNGLTPTTSSWSTANGSAFVPPIARVGYLYIGCYGADMFGLVRPYNVTSHAGYNVENAAYSAGQYVVPCSSDQKWEYKNSYDNAKWHIDVMGYKVTAL